MNLNRIGFFCAMGKMIVAQRPSTNKDAPQGCALEYPPGVFTPTYQFYVLCHSALGFLIKSAFRVIKENCNHPASF
jgi:hypothetical protein